jgi:hypothetical protein
MDTPRLTRRQYDKAVEFRQAVTLANGPQKIREAEKRLCGTCYFEAAAIAGMCGVNSLLAPLTLTGEDCPYYLVKNPAKSPEMPVSPPPCTNPDS